MFLLVSKDQLISLSHKTLGHLDVDKCVSNLKDKYWFPLVRSKLESFIRSCLPCILHLIRWSVTDLHRIPKAPIPFENIHIDHLQPLPCITSKRKHLFIFSTSIITIDAFNKFVKIHPVNSTSTKEVNTRLSKYFKCYSRPRRIMSDRGTCFTFF